MISVLIKGARALLLQCEDTMRSTQAAAGQESSPDAESVLHLDLGPLASRL